MADTLRTILRWLFPPAPAADCPGCKGPISDSGQSKLGDHSVIYHRCPCGVDSAWDASENRLEYLWITRRFDAVR